MSVINKNWLEIFKELNVLEKIKDSGFYEITSREINKFKEARLMTKFDHKSNLPQIFLENKLSILPLTRGSYIIGSFDAYQNVKYDAKISSTRFSIPGNIESIDINNLYSESSALNCAYISHMIDDLAGEMTLPTVSGRMSTGIFNYNIRGIINNNVYPISVINSQCEIDGGYEGLNKLILVEAKNFISDDFLVRQLYYPFRLWHNKISKEVIPVFMTYSNDIFSFFIYKFENINEYNSLKLIEQKNYTITPDVITLDDIYDVLQNVQIIQEPEVPFPQADSFLRVVDLLGLLTENELTSDDITNNYDFDKRQTSYYTDAGIYLGLIRKSSSNKIVTYCLNNKAKSIMSKRFKQKYLALTKCILEHEVFNKVLRKYFNGLAPVSKMDIVEIMNGCFIYNVKNQNTINRRAQTVNKWIEWILNLQSKKTS